MRSAVGVVRGWGDATTLLTVFIVLLFGIPAGYSIGPLGGIGSPALVFGLVLLAWWIVFRAARPVARPGLRQSPRLFMALFVVCVLVTYTLAMARPTGALEISAADRGVIAVLSWLGVFLVAMEGVTTPDRMDALLRRIAYAGGFLGALGVLQFLMGEPLIDKIQFPGLEQTSSIGTLMSSGSLNRPAGTALHPIEFGVVLAMVLPLALHYALEFPGRNPIRRWFPVLAIGFAIPISISRSAILGLIVVLAVLLPAWPGPRRMRAVGFMFVGILALSAVAPGVLGRIKALFEGVSGDSSVQSRTGGYELATDFISRTPLFGRGFYTFLPEYRIMDNQYLLTTIELGLVGVLVLLALYVSGMVTAWRIRRNASDPVTKHLGQSLLAAIGVFTLTFAFFDAFSFPIVSGLVFLILGATAGTRRLQWQSERAFDAEIDTIELDVSRPSEKVAHA